MRGRKGIKVRDAPFGEMNCPRCGKCKPTRHPKAKDRFLACQECFNETATPKEMEADRILVETYRKPQEIEASLPPWLARERAGILDDEDGGEGKYPYKRQRKPQKEDRNVTEEARQTQDPPKKIRIFGGDYLSENGSPIAAEEVDADALHFALNIDINKFEDLATGAVLGKSIPKIKQTFSGCEIRRHQPFTRKKRMDIDDGVPLPTTEATYSYPPIEFIEAEKPEAAVDGPPNEPPVPPPPSATGGQDEGPNGKQPCSVCGTMTATKYGKCGSCIENERNPDRWLENAVREMLTELEIPGKPDRKMLQEIAKKFREAQEMLLKIVETCQDIGLIPAKHVPFEDVERTVSAAIVSEIAKHNDRERHPLVSAEFHGVVETPESAGLSPWPPSLVIRRREAMSPEQIAEIVTAMDDPPNQPLLPVVIPPSPPSFKAPEPHSHYKRPGTYWLIGIGCEEATLRPVAVYMTSDGLLKTRPVEEFFAVLEVNGALVRRYKPL